MQFTVKIIEKGKIVRKVRTHKKRRFLKIIRLINWRNSSFRAYVKVDYGKFTDIFGRLTNFYNDGEYDNKEDFWLAFNAFAEE